MREGNEQVQVLKEKADWLRMDLEDAFTELHFAALENKGLEQAAEKCRRIRAEVDRAQKAYTKAQKAYM